MCLKGSLPCPDISQAEVVIKALLSAFLIIHFFLSFLLHHLLTDGLMVLFPVLKLVQCCVEDLQAGLKGVI